MQKLLFSFCCLVFALISDADTINQDTLVHDSLVSTVADTSIKPIKKAALTGKQRIYEFNVMEEIGPSIWRQMQQAFEEAKAWNATIFLIHMNTYGGLLVDADSMRTKLLNTDMTTIVFVDNNAASAGSLISISCDSIYMRKGANIGAATVVNQSGEKMPDKYQSYMRSTMRSTAEAKGRNPKIAEAMVDESVYIPGIVDSTKILTFTASEAVENGYCEGIAESIPEVLKLASVTDYDMREYQITTTEKIIGFLVNPIVSGILILVIVLGIYFELQTPGIGFPLMAAITAAALYFAPLYLQGLAANWEIIIFIVGLILLALEIFVIPGFGVAGISGIALILSGLILALVRNVGFNFDFSGVDSIARAFFIVVTSLVLGVVGAFFIGKRLFEHGFLSSLVLTTVQSPEEGYSSVDSKNKELIGKTGIAHTMLRPAGKVDIDGDIYDATALTGFVDKGEEVKVVKFETAQLFVTKVS